MGKVNDGPSDWKKILAVVQWQRYRQRPGGDGRIML